MFSLSLKNRDQRSFETGFNRFRTSFEQVCVETGSELV